jgi:hypothetical protein
MDDERDAAKSTASRTPKPTQGAHPRFMRVGLSLFAFFFFFFLFNPPFRHSTLNFDRSL